MKGTEEMKYSKKIVLIGVVFFINYFLDRLTKTLAVNFLQGKNQIGFLNDFVVLGYVTNNGAFLSMGSQWGSTFKLFIFIVLPILVCIVAILYCLFKEDRRFSIIVITSIAAGGIGNIQDRIFNNGHVIDFLNFGIGNIRTGVLNVADISVTFGVVFLLFYEIIQSIKEKRGIVSSN